MPTLEWGRKTQVHGDKTGSKDEDAEDSEEGNFTWQAAVLAAVDSNADAGPCSSCTVADELCLSAAVTVPATEVVDLSNGTPAAIDWVHYGGLGSMPSGGGGLEPPFFSERKRGADGQAVGALEASTGL